MSRFKIAPARADQGRDIADLFRIPMAGQIQISAEREPDYFLSAAVQNEKPRIFVGHDLERNRLAGVFSVGRRRVFVNGRSRDLPYFCDLRVREEYRNGTLLSRGFRYVRRHVLDGDEFAQTIVVADNLRALAALTSGRGGLPTYHPAGEYHTFAVSLRARPPRSKTTTGGLAIRRATEADRNDIRAFQEREAPRRQFYPAYDFARIGTEDPYYRGIRITDFWLAYDGGRLAGMLGIWDQKEFKQTRITGYAPALGAVRGLYNLGARITGGIQLPKAGSQLDYFNLHAILIENDDPRVFGELLAAVHAAYRDGPHAYFLCGLDADDPLAAAPRRFRHRLFRGRHFLISFGADPRPGLRAGPFYLETARI